MFWKDNLPLFRTASGPLPHGALGNFNSGVQPGATSGGIGPHHTPSSSVINGDPARVEGPFVVFGREVVATTDGEFLLISRVM